MAKMPVFRFAGFLRLCVVFILVSVANADGFQTEDTREVQTPRRMLQQWTRPAGFHGGTAGMSHRRWKPGVSIDRDPTIAPPAPVIREAIPNNDAINHNVFRERAPRSMQLKLGYVKREATPDNEERAPASSSGDVWHRGTTGAFKNGRAVGYAGEDNNPQGEIEVSEEEEQAHADLKGKFKHTRRSSKDDDEESSKSKSSSKSSSSSKSTSSSKSSSSKSDDDEDSSSKSSSSSSKSPSSSKSTSSSKTPSSSKSSSSSSSSKSKSG